MQKKSRSPAVATAPRAPDSDQLGGEITIKNSHRHHHTQPAGKQRIRERIIAVIPKNLGAEIQVSLRTFKGHKRIDIRTFVGAEAQRFATKQGASLNVLKIDALIQALQLARREAARFGWISESGEEGANLA